MPKGLLTAFARLLPESQDGCCGVAPGPMEQKAAAPASGQRFMFFKRSEPSAVDDHNMDRKSGRKPVPLWQLRGPGATPLRASFSVERTPVMGYNKRS